MIKIIKKRLDHLLFEKYLTESRSKAQSLIMSGVVYVNEKKETKSGSLHNINSSIQIRKKEDEWVSRGSFKLLEAIKYFNISVDGKICLDIGSSTGGFTQVLLNQNAKKIYSVDVGKNQLHEKLKKNKKIISLEKTNARYLTKDQIKDPIDILVCDVSFISLKKVIKPNLFLLNNISKILVLIKPQFETNVKNLRKGVVKSHLVHKTICDEIKLWFDSFEQMKFEGIIKSPIKGPKGNVEFLLCCNFINNVSNDQQ